MNEYFSNSNKRYNIHAAKYGKVVSIGIQILQLYSIKQTKTKVKIVLSVQHFTHKIGFINED